jgi:pyrroline-5-carboxylate reductase
MSGHKVCIIGCGMMGTAIANRLGPDNVLALYDKNGKYPSKVGKSYATACDAIKASDIIILAVRPQNLDALSKEIHKIVNKKKLLISILAGVSRDAIRNHFIDVPILRMMPNIAIETGSGVIGLAESPDMTPGLKKIVNELFAPLGTLHWLPEDQMNALSALTGSGPAFACVMIESIIDAAIHMGFKPEEGRHLTLEMLSGVVKMLKETNKHPADVKWEVTSPGGITIAGIRALEKSSVRSGIMQAFLAAFEKMK